MRTDVPLIVPVDRNPRGGWDIDLPDQHARVRCETLDDAKRMAFLRAAHGHACTVVVRDAYHRVLDEQFIAGDDDMEPLTAPPRPLIDVRRKRLSARRRGERR